MKNKPLIASLVVLFLLFFIALILSPHHKKPEHKPPVAYKGKIAIVIDDWGYHLDNLETAKQIKEHITAAVLPNLKNTQAVSQELHAAGWEIILHLPMEPKEKRRLEKDTITIGMDQAQIKEILDRDLNMLVHAKGVSNHMGSLVTEDVKTIKIVMAELKKRKLFFLDSFVTAKSVCGPLAKQMKLRFAQRNIFLDNEDDPEYIKGQLNLLKKTARTRGLAIGIGHDRKNTLLILKELLPQFAREGYKFVFVSEIAR